MKKVISILLSMLLLISTMAVPAFAYEVKESTYERTEPNQVANHLYETEYQSWNSEKAEFIGLMLAKEGHRDIDPELMKKYSGLYENLKDHRNEIIASLSYPFCTSCRTGDLIGRNFDWLYDDVDEYVMRVPSLANRHASVGVASGFFSPELQELIGIEDILPMLTMDGINDAGVAINVNVVASSDAAEIMGVDGYELAYTSGTNPDSVTGDLCAGFVVRYVLDKANSAEHAVELLKDINIYSIGIQEFHWMISDGQATYIVECVKNKLVVLKTKSGDSDHQAAMSNFHVTNSKHLNDYDVYYQPADHREYTSTEYTKLPMGIERYETVKDGLSSVYTREDMLENMRKVWYREQLYEKGNSYFWSDMNMHKYHDKDGKDRVFIYGDEKDDTVKNERLKAFEQNKELYKKAVETEKQYGKRIVDGKPNNVLQTVHTSVYDLNDKTLMVEVQERETPFCFALEDDVNANRTEVFVNGDNVGLAVRCDEAGEEWTYDSETKTLNLKHCGGYEIKGVEGSGITVNKPEHKWDAGKVTEEATVNHTGTKLYTCTECGATKTEVIPKIEKKPGTGDNQNLIYFWIASMVGVIALAIVMMLVAGAKKGRN